MSQKTLVIVGFAVLALAMLFEPPPEAKESVNYVHVQKWEIGHALRLCESRGGLAFLAIDPRNGGTNWAHCEDEVMFILEGWSEDDTKIKASL